MNKLILASGSERRIQILRDWGIQFAIQPADIDEEALSNNYSDLAPAALAMKLAEAKTVAVSLVESNVDDYVVGADTLVSLDNEIIGKPQDEQSAYRILNKLSNREQAVFTGMAIAQAGKVLARDVCCSLVKMKDLDDEKIWEYIRKEKPFDKAGAYAIQEGARDFVEYYEGCYFNIVGMPLCLLQKMVRDNNIALKLPQAIPNSCQNEGRVIQ